MIPLLALAVVAPPEDAAVLRLETRAHNGSVMSVVALPDGGFATAGQDKSVRLWNAEGRARGVLRYPIGKGAEGTPFSLSAAGGRLAVGTLGTDARGYLLDPKGGAAKAVGGPSRFVDATFLDDGRTVATLGWDLVLRLEGTGAPKKAKLAGDPDAIAFAALDAAPDGKTLYVRMVGTEAKTTLLAFDAKTLAPVGKELTVPLQVSASDAGSDGLWLAGPGYAARWKPGDAPTPLGLPDLDYTGVASAPDGGALFVGAGENQRGKSVFVGADGKMRWSGEAGDAFPKSVAVLKDGSAVVGNVLGALVRVRDGKATRLGEAPEMPLRIAWNAEGTGLLWSTEFVSGKEAPLAHGFNLAEGRAFDVDAANPGALAPGGAVATDALPEGALTAVRLPDGRMAASTADGLRVIPKGGEPVDLDTDGALVAGLAVSPDGRYLAATGNDGLIRLFLVRDLGGAKVRPAFLLRVGSDGEWIVWQDATCLYASSVEGDRILNLQRTDPKGRVLFEPIATRQKAYRKPALLLQAFRDGGAKDPTLARVTETASARIDLVTIRGAALKNDVWTATSNKVSLVFEVPDDVRSLKVSENVPTKDVVSASLEGDGSSRRILPVTLTPGENRIRVVGVREDGTQSVPQEVRLVAPGDESKGVLRVLAIGVSDYPGGTVAELPFNRNDVGRVAAHFQSLDGATGKVAVTVLPNDQTDRAGILKALAAFQATIQPEDTALLYVSSHGMEGPKGFVMLPKDVDPEKPADKGILWTTVVETISTRPCKAAILVQDACHSGGGVAKDKISPTFAAARDDADRLGKERNLYVFSSCGAEEVSYVDPIRQQSVFTGALLEALDGKLRNTDSDGNVLLDELQDPVRFRVREIIAELVKEDKLYKVTKGGKAVDPPQRPRLYSPWSQVGEIVVGKRKEGGK